MINNLLIAGIKLYFRKLARNLSYALPYFSSFNPFKG